MLSRKIVPVLFLALVFSGCGKGVQPPGFPVLRPCTVVVKNNGVPVAQAEVSFSMSGAPAAYAVYGTTDASGTAVMTTVQGVYSKAGAPEGDYVVTIKKEPEVEFGATAEQINSMSQAQVDALNAAYTQKKAQAEKIVPPALRDPEQSPLRLTVTNKDSRLTVDLTDHAPR